MIGAQKVPVIGSGFSVQNIMDSYFWYPFAGVWQCTYVMDKAKIPEDEWKFKGEDLADEQPEKLPGAHDSIRAGLRTLEAWLAFEFCAEERVLLCRRAPRRLFSQTNPS